MGFVFSYMNHICGVCGVLSPPVFLCVPFTLSHTVFSRVGMETNPANPANWLQTIAVPKVSLHSQTPQMLGGLFVKKRIEVSADPPLLHLCVTVGPASLYSQFQIAETRAALPRQGLADPPDQRG